MRILFKLILVASALISSQVWSWGQTGHRVTGQIAEYYLSPKARAAVAQLLPLEDLAQASTFADEMRSNPSEFWQKTSTPWHYVNVYLGKNYEKAPPEGDAVSALNQFKVSLLDPNTPLVVKQVALRFIVHIIGDLHQPLHSGTDQDRGGNTIEVNFFGQDTNLHQVWDSGLIDRQKLSYTEWSTRLKRGISEQQANTWMEPNPLIWVAESVEIRANVYPQKKHISWGYQYDYIPTIHSQLQKGGVRIAAYLNHLFK
jgi:hypothetical protein